VREWNCFDLGKEFSEGCYEHVNEHSKEVGWGVIEYLSDYSKERFRSVDLVSRTKQVAF
jgi:hypothetical protein